MLLRDTMADGTKAYTSVRTSENALVPASAPLSYDYCIVDFASDSNMTYMISAGTPQQTQKRR